MDSCIESGASSELSEAVKEWLAWYLGDGTGYATVRLETVSSSTMIEAPAESQGAILRLWRAAEEQISW